MEADDPFVVAVREMRKHQVRWFTYHNTLDMADARAAEKIVDRMLAERFDIEGQTALAMEDEG